MRTTCLLQPAAGGELIIRVCSPHSERDALKLPQLPPAQAGDVVGSAAKRSKGSRSGSAAADVTPSELAGGRGPPQRKGGEAQGGSDAEDADLTDSDGSTSDAKDGTGVHADSPVTCLDRIGVGKAQALEALNIKERVLGRRPLAPACVRSSCRCSGVSVPFGVRRA
jgi:hypothetical protein